MKFLVKNIFIILIGISLSNFKYAERNVLRVTITNLKEAKGYAGIGLYDKAENFPIAGKTVMVKRVEVKAVGSVVIELSNIADGTYAIAATHDLNGNNKFDMNFMGIPKEPYGFSNNIRHSFSAPTFEECKFTVSGGIVKNLSIKVD
jgi:uncharacterized protein (DUF2141 family)